MQCSLFKTPFNALSGTVILANRSADITPAVQKCCGKVGSSSGTAEFVSIKIHSQPIFATLPLLEALMWCFHSFSVSMEMHIFPADSGF